MKNTNTKPTITLKISDIKLRIIRVGKSPGLEKTDVRDDRARIHTHFTYEAFFVTEGSLVIQTQNKNITCERKVVIIPPDMGHYTVPDGDGCYCVLFSVEKSGVNDAKASYLNSVLQNGICELDISEDMAYYIRAFARKSSENTPFSEKHAALLAELIFCEIIEKLTPLKADSSGTKAGSWCVGAIETFINANLGGRITLDDIANHVYLSTRQVSRIIRQEYGMSLSHLVAEKKLRTAEMLLGSTDMKVKDIAASVNLGSDNYFFEMFKKKYGMSPLEYRNNVTKSKSPDSV